MAVLTPLSKTEINRLLNHYNLPSLMDFEAIEEGIENTNYRLHLPERKCILTLFEGRVRKRDIPYFMALTQHLSEAGLPVAKPYLNQEGSVISLVKGKPVIITECLPGRPASKKDHDLLPELGKIVAHMHETSQSFNQRRLNPLGISGLQKLAQQKNKEIEKIAPDAANLVSQTFDLPHKTKLPHHAMHTDLFPDNVLTTKGKVTGLIDFYFTADETAIYDIAVILTAWIMDKDGKMHWDNARAFLQGYQSTRPLEDEEWQAFPAALCRANLRFFLTRTEVWFEPAPANAKVRRKNPLSYLNKLKETLKYDTELLKRELNCGR